MVRFKHSASTTIHKKLAASFGRHRFLTKISRDSYAKTLKSRIKHLNGRKCPKKLKEENHLLKQTLILLQHQRQVILARNHEMHMRQGLLWEHHQERIIVRGEEGGASDSPQPAAAASSHERNAYLRNGRMLESVTVVDAASTAPSDT